MEKNRIINGDSLSVLQQMPDCCIDCCVTSPPLLCSARLWGAGADWVGGVSGEICGEID